MSKRPTHRVRGVELGLGLIGIGRPWPTPEAGVCPTERAWALLDRAIELNIRFFDTASGEVGAVGVGVSSEATLRAALDVAVFDTVQFPANSANADVTTASGALADTGNPFAFHAVAFRRAVVLTGTTKVDHIEATTGPDL